MCQDNKMQVQVLGRVKGCTRLRVLLPDIRARGLEIPESSRDHSSRSSRGFWRSNGQEKQSNTSLFAGDLAPHSRAKNPGRLGQTTYLEQPLPLRWGGLCSFQPAEASALPVAIPTCLPLITLQPCRRENQVKVKCLCLEDGALAINVLSTGDRGGGKPEGEPGPCMQLASWSPFSQGGLITKPQPPVIRRGWDGVWRWMEGGLLILRAN